jgi:hypothetical protein
VIEGTSVSTCRQPSKGVGVRDRDKSASWLNPSQARSRAGRTADLPVSTGMLCNRLEDSGKVHRIGDEAIRRRRSAPERPRRKSVGSPLPSTPSEIEIFREFADPAGASGGEIPLDTLSGRIKDEFCRSVHFFTNNTGPPL